MLLRALYTRPGTICFEEYTTPSVFLGHDNRLFARRRLRPFGIKPQIPRPPPPISKSNSRTGVKQQYINTFLFVCRRARRVLFTSIWFRTSAFTSLPLEFEPGQINCLGSPPTYDIKQNNKLGTSTPGLCSSSFLFSYAKTQHFTCTSTIYS